jgi:hypothetical protein
MAAETDRPALAWWRVRMVWLVIAGPALVVAAGVVTTVLAARGADPVVSAHPTTVSQAPAVQARNHAAAPKR